VIVSWLIIVIAVNAVVRRSMSLRCEDLNFGYYSLTSLVQERDYAAIILTFWLRFYTRGIVQEKEHVYASVMNRDICEGYYLGSRGNRGLICIADLKKKYFLTQ